MDIVVAADVPVFEQGNEKGRQGHKTRPGGTLRQFLLEDDAPDGLNFRLHRNEFRGGDKTFSTPRHNHAFQQFRFAEKGNINYGTGVDIPEGDIAYFPRTAYYGPQEMDSGVVVALQYGFNGEFQEGPAWDEVIGQAMERLKANGEFDGPYYYERDPVTGGTRKRDGVGALYEAKYELRTGRKFVTPSERYSAAILMHPRAFSYFEASPGVELKHLGRFYDQDGPSGDARLSMARLSGGAHQLGADRAQIVWTANPGLRIDGQEYPELTYAYSPLGETMPLSGTGGIELFVVEFPRLG